VCAGFSRTSAWDNASVMGNAIINFLTQVPAPHVKGKGIEQSAGEAFATEFLSTYRALGISPFMDVDAQSGSGFRHPFHVVTEYHIVYVNVNQIARPSLESAGT
jgi:hypothetical protein